VNDKAVVNCLWVFFIFVTMLFGVGTFAWYIMVSGLQ